MIIQGPRIVGIYYFYVRVLNSFDTFTCSLNLPFAIAYADNMVSVEDWGSVKDPDP